MSIHYLNALAGAGKTRAFVRYADRLARKGLKTLIVQPTKDLIDKTVADELEQIGPSYPVTRFHGGRGSGFVVGAIVQHLRQAKPDQGEIVFITHEAFVRLPYVHRPGDWVLLFDEVPAVDVFDPYELPVTHSLITDHLALEVRGPAYPRLKCRDEDAAKVIGKIADNRRGDVVLKKLQPLARRLVSEHWQVHVDQRQYARLIRGEKTDSTLNTYAVLKPTIFAGFKRVILASACIQETMAFKLFEAQRCKMLPVKGRLLRDLRYTRHEHGERITIFYACDEAWSKRYRDKLVEDGVGGSIKLGDKIGIAVLDQFGDVPFLWMGNKDVKDNIFGVAGAQRLPNTPHGLNQFQGFHNIVVISALNPPPQHFRFLAELGIDGDEVRTAHYRTAVYQAVMRSSIRNPADAAPKQVVVMDRDTAEWLADLFPGATVAQLPGLDVVPRKGKAGRPRQHKSGSERTKSCRAEKHKALLAELDRLNGTDFAMNGYPDLDPSEFGCNDIASIERDYVTPISPLSGTAFATIYDKTPLSQIDYQDDDAFVAELRRLHQDVVAKEDAGLFAPASFDATRSGETARGLANVTYLRGIWLDNDGGDLTYAAFADLFPHLRVVVWNTASSTPEKPRWRVFIPTTCAMSVEVHKLIIAEIVGVLERAGYWGQRKLEKDARLKGKPCHGFDESKFTANSMFYLPCQARHPKGSFFTDFGVRDPCRGPLSVHDWLDHVIGKWKPEPEIGPILPLTNSSIVLPNPAPTASPPTRLQMLREQLAQDHRQSAAGRQDEKVGRAIEAWRSTPSGMGHHNFFVLGAALWRAGLEPHEVKAKLQHEVMFSTSPRERRGEIGGIIKKLERSGTFGRRGA
ncbi:DEAD/DEAH box helicase family protein [Bosea beijingensis]|uniref:DEAD/DEAH box helicase family protein n=1 Tax=Bosea beijingensis TaxID=3068632 RepID=UPI002741B975|nr:DEAD/DEAH box helicase family protein [Bosea sp. REN20]